MYIKKEIEKKCKECGKEFITGYPKKYCSRKCYLEHIRKTYRPHPYQKNLCSGTIGTINELIVCTDLMKKGYAVFRAVSYSCSCDLVIFKDKKLSRVEVTSGWFVNGKVKGRPHKKENYDIMAIVIAGEKIFYEGL